MSKQVTWYTFYVMSNKDILEEAIQKAIDGGWKEPDGNTLRVDDNGSLFCFINGAEDGVRAYGFQFNIERLIYSHDFAKALWGEWLMAGRDDGTPHWKYHLRNMVVSDDPIKYLGENI